MKLIIIAALTLSASAQSYRDFRGPYSKRGAAVNYYSPSEPQQFIQPSSYTGSSQYRALQSAASAQKPIAYASQEAAGQQAYTGPQQFYPQAQGLTQGQSQQAYSKVPQFSLAADVSSFAYSSPVVKYNNQGITSQLIGNNPQSVKSSFAPVSQKSAYSSIPSGKSQYSSPQALTYQTIPSSQYSSSSSPSVTFTTTSAQSDKYSNSQPASPDYTALAQKFALQAQEYAAQPQDYSAQSQKYTQVPQYLAQPQQYQAGEQAQQYVQQPQQYSQQPQVVYAQPEGHQSAQSVRQFTFSKPFGKFYSSPSRYNYDNY